MSNRLIFLEGLPGTGKSTNSFKLYEQLLLNGKKYDAFPGSLDRYELQAAEKWDVLAEYK